MPTPGQELASIDFASMLGGPLVAAVNAQAQAAIRRCHEPQTACFASRRVSAPFRGHPTIAQSPGPLAPQMPLGGGLADALVPATDSTERFGNAP